MSKKVISLLVAVVFVFTIALTGCSGASTPAAADTKAETPKTEAPKAEESKKADAAPAAAKGKLVGDPNEEYYCIAFLSGIDYWKGVFKGFQDAGNAYGVKTLYAGDPGYDVNKSVTVFEQVVAKKPAGIAVACINADAFVDPIKKAREAGIEVVTYDSDSPKSERSSYLSTGNKAAGEVAANHMMKLLPDGGDIALLYSVGQQNVEERVIGFENTLKAANSKINIKVKVNDKGDQLEATKGLAAALQANADIKGVFCIDGVAGVAGATAVKESGKKGIKTIGFDTDKALLDMIKDGSIDATIAQGTYNMGYWSMNFLFQLKHKIPAGSLPNFVDTGVNVVTKDNVDQYYVK